MRTNRKHWCNGCVMSHLQDSVTIWNGKQITVYELSGAVLLTGKVLKQRPIDLTQQHVMGVILCHWLHFSSLLRIISM